MLCVRSPHPTIDYITPSFFLGSTSTPWTSLEILEHGHCLPGCLEPLSSHSCDVSSYPAWGSLLELRGSLWRLCPPYLEAVPQFLPLPGQEFGSCWWPAQTWVSAWLGPVFFHTYFTVGPKGK